MNIWTDEEKRILREAYPYEGARGAINALRLAGFPVRTPRSIQCAARYYGIQALPDMHGAIRHGDRRHPAQPMNLSPTRPVTPDSVELVHWFAQRGFTPEKIAKEINRPLSVVRELLQINPPAVDKPDYWPRSVCAMAGRLSSTVSNFKQGRAIA